eukprot:jgi/Psemu1/34725/gm1.34725_g
MSITPTDNDSQAATTKDDDGPPTAKKRHQSKSLSKVALPVIFQEVIPEAVATKLDAGSSKPKKGQNGVQGRSAEGKEKVTPKAVCPVPDAMNIDTGSSKTNKGQNGVQGGSAEGKKKGKSESQSEVLQYIPGEPVTKANSMRTGNNDKTSKEPGKTNNSIKTGNNDIKCNFQPTVDGKPSHVRNMKLPPTNYTQPLAKNDNNKKWKQNVKPLNYILDVTAMFKDPDPEIVYPTYQIGEAVYVGVKSHSKLVYDYLSEPYKGCGTYPGYQLLFPADDRNVAPFREQDCHIYTISDLVQFYGEEPGKDEVGEDGNTVQGQSGKAWYNNNGNSSSHFSSDSTPLSENSSFHSSSDSTPCPVTREAYLV